MPFTKKRLSWVQPVKVLRGLRGEMEGFYAGYFRDLDGNKLNGFYLDMPTP